MITRKLGSLLRGKATPFQVAAACVLGALLGFAPGILQGPALVLLLVAALLVVNANLGLALLVAGGARLLALLLAPVSFSIGRFLLEGPTEGLVFAYWHDQEQSRMINKVTKDDYDPVSKEPEFKICAVQVKRVSGPQPLKPFLVGA